MDKNNMFIASLKFAYQQMEPFSYIKLLEQLKRENVVPNHYQTDGNYPEVLRIYEYIIGQRLTDFNKHRNFSYPPTGEALSRHIEFLELKLAREAANDANRQATRANNKALLAIGIAIVALTAQVIFGIVENLE